MCLTLLVLTLKSKEAGHSFESPHSLRLTLHRIAAKKSDASKLLLQETTTRKLVVSFYDFTAKVVSL